MRKYSDLVARGKARHGDKFSESSLDPRFVRYYESGERIKVRTCDMELTGTVGVTTGWVPCFLLMRTSRSIGSPWTLGEGETVIACKVGKRYIPL